MKEFIGNFLDRWFLKEKVEIDCKNCKGTGKIIRYLTNNKYVICIIGGFLLLVSSWFATYPTIFVVVLFGFILSGTGVLYSVIRNVD